MEVTIAICENYGEEMNVLRILNLRKTDVRPEREEERWFNLFLRKR